MDRQVVCFQIPSFQIALARLANTSLRGWPVAVAPHGPRAALREISAEARREGLFVGMAATQARRLCPSLRLIPPESAKVDFAQRYLLEVIRRFAPVWEDAGPGHLFLDLTGTSRLFGPPADTAIAAGREISRRYRLSGAVGVASNKLVSGVAVGLIQPSELCDVRPGSERDFLAPVPITSLPGLSRLYGTKSREIISTLEDLNLKTLGEMAALEVADLEPVLGPQAPLLHQWSHGSDPTPVWPKARQPLLEASWILDMDEVDDQILLAILYGLLERLCRDLRRQKRLCGCLDLTLAHSDGLRITKAERVADTCWESDLYPSLRGLFLRSFRRRVRIRMMSLAARNIASHPMQLPLFPEELSLEEGRRLRRRQLSLALDAARERFGEAAVRRGGF